MRGAALALVSVVLAAAGGAATLDVAPARAAALSPPDSRIFDIGRPPEETCGKCHADILAEWRPSLHGRSWSNDNALVAGDSFKREECRACHSPEAVLALPQGIETAHHVYTRPLFRERNGDSGVHCLSCHGEQGGA